MTTNINTHNATVPTSIGALLTEENTIDPLSHLPSFLELAFVDVASSSGRKALDAAWNMCLAWLESAATSSHRSMLSYSGPRRVNSDGNDRMENNGNTLMRRIRYWSLFWKNRICQHMLRSGRSFGPELQFLVIYCLQYHCMHNLAGAAASEMVYGLKRSKVVRAKEKNDTQQHYRISALTTWDKHFSAFFVAFLPYFKGRLDTWYNAWKESQNDANTTSYHNHNNSHNVISNNINRHGLISFDAKKLKSFKQWFTKLYPYLHMTHEGSIFLFQFGYLLGYTPFWSPSLRLMGLMLRRITMADMQSEKKQRGKLPSPSTSFTSSSPVPSSAHSRISRPLSSTEAEANRNITNNPSERLNMNPKLTIPNVAKGVLAITIAYAAVSRWWSYFQRELRLRRRRWISGEDSGERENGQRSQSSSGTGREERLTVLPIPPPMPPPRRSPASLLDDGIKVLDKWSCPICHGPRINPAASTAGYVFCYKCLILHIRQKGEYCPVTGVPCPESKVVRLYEPTARKK